MAKIKCTYCGCELAPISYKRHLIENHGLTQKDAFIECLAKSTAYRTKNVEYCVNKGYYERLYKYNKCELKYDSQFSVFYKILTSVREFDARDYDTFFNTYLPWKLKHPKSVNDREITRIIFYDDAELEQRAYELNMLNRNPFKEHDCRLSPFSRHFNGYNGMCDDEKDKLIRDRLGYDRDDRTQTQINYWIKRGYTKDEANAKISELQRTFTLEKCIEKYGIVDGTQIWNDRQKRWVASLTYHFINVGDNRTPKSNFEVQSVKAICEILQIDVPKTQKFISDKQGNHYSFDFNVGNRLIEFNGDYWHMNPKIYKPNSINKRKGMSAVEIWEYDKQKTQCAVDNGYDVLTIWESEYNENPADCISRCVQFLRK